MAKTSLVEVFVFFMLTYLPHLLNHFGKLFRNLSGFDLNFVFLDYKCYNQRICILIEG